MGRRVVHRSIRKPNAALAALLSNRTTTVTHAARGHGERVGSSYTERVAQALRGRIENGRPVDKVWRNGACESSVNGGNLRAV